MYMLPMRCTEGARAAQGARARYTCALRYHAIYARKPSEYILMLTKYTYTGKVKF